VALLLLAHAALLAWGAYRHSPAIDAWAHLPSGLIHWQQGRFDLYRVNPPLVRLVAAVPLLLVGPHAQWEIPPASGAHRPEVDAAIALYFACGPRVFGYFTVARLACIPFSLLGGWVCYRWAGALYGRAAGMLALVLWCFSPDILAHGQMITPDLGATALGLAANYAYWHWLRAPTWSGALVAGAGLGLALSAKTTWIVLLVLWPLAWLVARWTRRGASAFMLRGLLQLAAIPALSAYMVNLVYGFRGSLSSLGDLEFVSAALRGPPPQAEAASAAGTQTVVDNRFRGTLLGRCRIPLPRDFILGIDRQKLDFESRFPSYLRGQWRDGGWWYYYLYAMAVKVPLGMWGMLVLAAVAIARGRRRGFSPDEAWLLLPALAVLVLVSSQTVYPHSLAYFNESVGGPRCGHLHLLGSSVDWAQDFLYLREWLAGHPEVAPRGVALDCSLPSQLVGVDAPAPPTEPTAGWYAVSVDRMHDPSNQYAYFFEA